MGDVIDDDIDRLIGYAEGAFRLAVNGDTRRVETALKFIPTLVTIIEHQRGQLALSRAKEGGHIETTISGSETRTVCSTCGTVFSQSPDLHEAG